MNMYEERTFKIEAIEIRDTYISTAVKKTQQKNNDCDYIAEAIREAFKCFRKADKNKFLSKSNSRYFYDEKSVKILINLLDEIKLNHPIGFRNIGNSECPCFEVNFQEVLDRTKPEEY